MRVDGELTMARYRTMMRFLLSVGILFQGCDSNVKCRNDEGEEVDWYILYKLPRANDEGLTYLYMDESTNGWELSTENINSNSGTLANTLKPLFDSYNRETEGFGYMLYNDQPPNSKAAGPSYGHSKGVVMLDKKTGVWLSHSTPKFPTYRSEDFWPDSGNVNGQTFMCVTFSYSEFRKIGLQLKYIHPYSYDSDVPKTFHNDLRRVAQRRWYPTKQPWFKVTTLTSMEGRDFKSFAKYTRFRDDLYSGLIVKHLKRNLCVKSWGKMRNPLPHKVSPPHHVYNVKNVELEGQAVPDTLDHSKWCVTPDDGWSCIADMNREVSQRNRGGGAICINDDAVRDAFYTLIPENEKCKPCEHSDAKHREL